MRAVWYNRWQTPIGGQRMSRAARTEARAEGIAAASGSGTLARITGLRTFRPLENPVYRSLWFGLLTVYMAMQVSMITRGYLAFQLSGSAASLGLVMLA